MPKPEKIAVVEEIRTKLDDADAAVLTEYRGLTVRALAELRGSLRPANTEYKVFKNPLARRAAEEAGLTDIARPARRARSRSPSSAATPRPRPRRCATSAGRTPSSSSRAASSVPGC